MKTLDWDDYLLDLFGVPERMLPEIRPSSESYGQTLAELFGRSIPVMGATRGAAPRVSGWSCNSTPTGCGRAAGSMRRRASVTGPAAIIGP